MGKPKQKQLPALEDQHDDDLTDRVDEYVEKRDARMAATKEETAARERLMLAMKERKLTRYQDPQTDRVVTIEAKEKIKVRSGDDETDDEGGDADE